MKQIVCDVDEDNGGMDHGSDDAMKNKWMWKALTLTVIALGMIIFNMIGCISENWGWVVVANFFPLFVLGIASLFEPNWNEE